MTDSTSLLFSLFPAPVVWICFAVGRRCRGCGSEYNNARLTRRPIIIITRISKFGFIALSTYLLPVVWQSVTYARRDFRVFYGAKWALVTGGSSGYALKPLGVNVHQFAGIV